jgi:hypothetical protein
MPETEELLSFALITDYGKNRLQKADLPFIPEPLAFAVRKKKTAKGMAVDKSAIKRLETIRKRLERSDDIILAKEPEIHSHAQYKKQ